MRFAIYCTALIAFLLSPASWADSGFSRYPSQGGAGITANACVSNQFASSISGSGILSCSTIPDAGLAIPYLKADGTRGLSANWNAGAFSITASSFVGALTGNASTASALAAIPTACGANTYATSIAASGNLSCSSVADVGLATSYLKADGTRGLTGNWSNGTFSITTNGVVIGSNPNQISGLGFIANGTGSLTVPSNQTDTFTLNAYSQNLSNKTLNDTTTSVVNTTDTTKALKFDLSGATTAKTLTLAAPMTASVSYTIPASAGNDTFAMTGLPQVLFSKGLVTGTNTTYFRDSTDSTKKLQFALSPATTATTLTINGNQSTTQSIDIPNVGASDAFVTKNATATLTNKTINGLQLNASATKTSAYTITNTDDFVKGDATSGAFTITLPAPSSNTGHIFTIQKVATDTTYNAITIARNGTEKINGTAANTTLNTFGETLRLQTDGTDWFVLSRDYPKNWISFTPTGSWTTNTTYTGKRRRNGTNEEYDVYVLMAGSPGGSTALSINIPNSLSIDNAQLASTAAIKLGDGWYHNAGDDYGDLVVAYNSLTSVPIYYGLVTATSTTLPIINLRTVTPTAPGTPANNDMYHVKFSVPISGWN